MVQFAFIRQPPALFVLLWLAISGILIMQFVNLPAYGSFMPRWGQDRWEALTSRLRGRLSPIAELFDVDPPHEGSSIELSDFIVRKKHSHHEVSLVSKNPLTSGRRKAFVLAPLQNDKHFWLGLTAVRAKHSVEDTDTTHSIGLFPGRIVNASYAVLRRNYDPGDKIRLELVTRQPPEKEEWEDAGANEAECVWQAAVTGRGKAATVLQTWPCAKSRPMYVFVTLYEPGTAVEILSETCATHHDCYKNPARGQCDLSSNLCVECSSHSHCGERKFEDKTYCDALSGSCIGLAKCEAGIPAAEFECACGRDEEDSGRSRRVVCAIGEICADFTAGACEPESFACRCAHGVAVAQACENILDEACESCDSGYMLVNQVCRQCFAYTDCAVGMQCIDGECLVGDDEGETAQGPMEGEKKSIGLGSETAEKLGMGKQNEEAAATTNQKELAQKTVEKQEGAQATAKEPASGSADTYRSELDESSRDEKANAGHESSAEKEPAVKGEGGNEDTGDKKNSAAIQTIAATETPTATRKPATNSWETTCVRQQADPNWRPPRRTDQLPSIFFNKKCDHLLTKTLCLSFRSGPENSDCCWSKKARAKDNRPMCVSKKALAKQGITPTPSSCGKNARSAPLKPYILPSVDWLIHFMLESPRIGRCFAFASSGEEAALCAWKLSSGVSSLVDERLVQRFAQAGCPTSTLAMLPSKVKTSGGAADNQGTEGKGDARALVILWLPQNVTRRDLVRTNMIHFSAHNWQIALASKDDWPEEPWWSHFLSSKTTQYYATFADKWAFTEYVLSIHDEIQELFDFVFVPDWWLLYTRVDLRAFAREATRHGAVTHIQPTSCDDDGNGAGAKRNAAPLIATSFLPTLITTPCAPLKSREVATVGAPISCKLSGNDDVTIANGIVDTSLPPCKRSWSRCWQSNSCTVNASPPEAVPLNDIGLFAVPGPPWLFSQLALLVGTPNKVRAQALFRGPKTTRETLQRLWNLTQYMAPSRQLAFADAQCPTLTFAEAEVVANKPTPARPKWTNPKARRKNVVIMAVGAERLDIVRANAYHFMAHDFDMILGHYDMKMHIYLREPWYTEDLVVFAVEKRIRGKYNFWEEIYDDHRSLMEQYNYVLLPDADFVWNTVDLTCYVKNANGFGIVGPAVIGFHRAEEQDPWFVRNGKKCSVRTVNDIEVQAPMFPRKSLKKLRDLLLPENHDSSGELQTCWCVDYVWCGYIGRCGLYETCGNPIHCNTRSLNKKDKKWWAATKSNCVNLRRRFSPFFRRHWNDIKRLPNHFKCYNNVSEAVHDSK